jgi:hypothetical protein
MGDNLFSRDVTALIDRLAERATAVTREALPARLKQAARVPGVHAKALSQARNGARTNPAFRHALYIVAIRAAGYPVSHAYALLDFQRDVVRQLWHGESRPVEALSDEEQQAEGAETSAQVRYRENRPETRRHWLAALRAERAITDELIAALEVEERTTHRWTEKPPKGWAA